jgi:hypothetical protein
MKKNRSLFDEFWFGHLDKRVSFLYIGSRYDGHQFKRKAKSENSKGEGKFVNVYSDVIENKRIARASRGIQSYFYWKISPPVIRTIRNELC